MGMLQIHKMTSLLPVGFIAQLVEHRTSFSEVTGWNPIQAWILIRLSFRNCLTLSRPRVPYGTRRYNELSIWSICVKFAQPKDLGKICKLKA